MSYQVIARKYRPLRFADVVGQEHVTQTLANAIQQNRIAHAYLFCGPRGTGKTTIARIFAKCLNCTGGPKVDFEDSDPRCREITEGRSIDVLEIDGASNNGVEQVRELRETVKYAPASSKFKVYIIDEVHMLSTAAFNALLKTLEEPPAHVKFMFATTDPEKVLATILSRCQRFDLRRIPSALIVKHLAQISALEGIQIDDAALFAIARGADGGMRDAESTLDQLISFCGTQIAENDVLSMFGLAARQQLLELAEAMLRGDTGKVLHEVDCLTKSGKDLGRLLSDLLNHFRNLLIFQVSRGDTSLLEVSEADKEALAKQASLATSEGVGRIMEILTDSEGRLRDAVSKRIFLEITLLRGMQGRNSVSLDSVLKQLTRLRELGPQAEPASGAPLDVVSAAPAPVFIPPGPPAAVVSGTYAPSPKPAPAEPVLSIAAPVSISPDLGGTWHALLEAAGRVSQFTRSYLLKGFPVSLAKGVFTIGYDPEFAECLPLVDNAKNHALIQTKLKELGCGDVQVRFVQAEAPQVPQISTVSALPVPAPIGETPLEPPSERPNAAQPAPAPTAKPPAPSAAEPQQKLDPADFKNDPLIRKALDVFRGQIAEVRG